MLQKANYLYVSFWILKKILGFFKFFFETFLCIKDLYIWTTGDTNLATENMSFNFHQNGLSQHTLAEKI